MFSFEHISAVTILHFWSHNCLALPWFFLAFPFLCWLVPSQHSLLVPLILLFSFLHVAFKIGPFCSSLFSTYSSTHPLPQFRRSSGVSARFGFLFYVIQSSSPSLRDVISKWSKVWFRGCRGWRKITILDLSELFSFKAAGFCYRQ